MIQNLSTASKKETLRRSFLSSQSDGRKWGVWHSIMDGFRKTTYISSMQRGGWVYIITNKYNTTLYIGVTSDLYSRIVQHRNKHYPNSFSAKYNLSKLVYYENFSRIEEAIAREKQIKGWLRIKKVAIIEHQNPEWNDLFDQIEQ
ncbi:GIY-YIG nuclease family protein [Marinoscillum sp. MHG1-6]|uniref:GIY-YIG nuclease family protein n=1 Tax=Marinoscillum sp. MHG1-6 TaxID=2959627 RepID=UPI00280BCCB8|nr:GIY-YIG nuclease family protein [Marinoscillum sp. MHG1-6]